MKLTIWMQKVGTQVGERWLVSWSLPEIPQGYLEDHYTELRGEAEEIAAQLNEYALELDDRDCMDAGSVCYYISAQVREYWSLPTLGSLLVAGEAVSAFITLAMEQEGVVVGRNDGILSIEICS